MYLKKLCLDFDGNLASVHSYDEYMFIKNLIGYKGFLFCSQEGVWLWSDESKMNFQIWAPGQPDDFEGSEDCILMNYDSDGYWHDVPCSGKKPFVCVN
ncbi:type-2 ice-structuring protein-like [Siphateles boraxobius]|uniref:type-2 ice-structuring protein-like n=1 Tax=Siphateles boraxobius TaxID=180520 RepID=UPI0040629783